VVERTITDTLPEYPNSVVSFHRRGGTFTITEAFPPKVLTVTTDENGAYSIDLWPNSEGLSETSYLAVYPNNDRFEFVLDPGDTPITAAELRDQESWDWTVNPAPSLIDVERARYANDASSVLGDALVGTRLPLTDTVARTVHDRLADTYHIADWGATAASSAAVTAAAFQDALTAIEDAGGGVIHLATAATYDMSAHAGAMSLASNMTIEGNGATLDMRESAFTFTFDISGTVGDPVTPRVDMLYGEEYIELPAAAVHTGEEDPDSDLIGLGDWVELGSTAKYVTMEDTQTPQIGQANRIIKIEESETPGYYNLYLDGVIYGDVSSGQRWTPWHVFHYNGSYTDLTNAYDRAVNTTVSLDFDIGDYLYIGHRSPFDAVHIRFLTFASAGNQVIEADYWDGTTWADADVTTDDTAGFTQNGVIRHSARYALDLVGSDDNWEPTTVNGAGGTPEIYWLRLRVTGDDLNTIELREIDLVTCSGYLLSDDAYCRKRFPVENVHIRDLNILAKTDATSIQLSRVHHATISNIDILGGGGYAIIVSSCEDVTLRDCHLQGDRDDDPELSGGTSYGLGIGGHSRNITADALHIERYRHSIIGQASLTGVARFVNIVNCMLVNQRGWGAISHHGQFEYMRIVNNTFLNSTQNLLDTDPNYHRAVLIYGSHTLVESNHFSGNRYGVSVLYGSNITIRGNIFSNCSGPAISTGGTNMDGLIIEGNSIDRTTFGIEIGSDQQNAIISGNRIAHFSAGGIVISELGYDVRGLTITNNTFFDNGGSSASNAIQSLDGSTITGILVANNIFSRMFTAPLLLFLGTVSRPMWTNANVQIDSHYDAEDHIPWRKQVVLVPSNEDSTVIIANGASYTVSNIVLSAAEARTATYLADKVIAFPPGDLDTKGVEWKAYVTADGLAELKLTNRTGSSQTLAAARWMLNLQRTYE
jgi:parallel beta-helix repeat protein